ncbi:hypothetical protein VEx25_1620, partial [Vibrio antiquarius]
MVSEPALTKSQTPTHPRQPSQVETTIECLARQIPLFG